jgi:ectoine hydroxylase-related dioxygenase (phytanoyl-CoA dioxygenase family)
MGPDLSSFSHPITGNFESNLADGSLRLSADQVDLYNLNGYLAGVRVLTEGQVETLRSDLAELMRSDYARDARFYEYHLNESSEPGQMLFHALGAWRISAAFHDLLFNRALTVPLQQLLGGPVRFWHDQLFVKPARDGGIVAWHQDYSYWTRTKPLAHLTCWIGLDDSTVDNGCVHYVPGSHRWNLLPRGSLADDMDAIFDRLTVEQKREFKPVAIELKMGEASFHHPKMIHGSYGNRTDRPRRAAIVNVFRDGVCSDTDEPLLDGVPVIPKGRKIEGQFFPLLT